MMDRRRALLSANNSVNNQLIGNFGEATLETVTVTSAAANMQAAVIAVKNLASTPANVVAIKRVNSKSPNPSSDEFGGWYLHTTSASNTTPGATGYRYHQNAWGDALINTNYTAKITSGSVFELVLLSYNARWNE